jgi:hypothetical protein
MDGAIEIRVGGMPPPVLTLHRDECIGVTVADVLRILSGAPMDVPREVFTMLRAHTGSDTHLMAGSRVLLPGTYDALRSRDVLVMWPKRE